LNFSNPFAMRQTRTAFPHLQDLACLLPMDITQRQILRSNSPVLRASRWFKKLLILLAVCQFTACDAVLPPDRTENFGKIAQSFLSDYYHFFPDETPLSIDNNNLSKMAIPTQGYLDSLRQFQLYFAAELRTYDNADVSNSILRDKAKMRKILQNIEAYLEDAPHNPQRYNVLFGFKRILTADYASDEYRLQTIFNKLEHIPVFYATAKARLRQVNPDAADAAIEQHVQTYQFFDKNLEQMLKSRRQLTPQYQARLTAAKLAIKDYAAFVESFKVE
jgi:hypothetical protein